MTNNLYEYYDTIRGVVSGVEFLASVEADIILKRIIYPDADVGNEINALSCSSYRQHSCINYIHFDLQFFF